MNLSTIIFIIIAFLLGAIISFFLKKGKTVSPDNSENENALSKLVKENENLKTEILKIKSEKDAENEDKLNKLKEKYEKLIQEANSKSEDLNKRLKSFLEKDGNENLKNQIDEIENLKKEIRKLNDKIGEHQEEIEDYENKISKQKKELSEKDEEYDKLDKDFRDKRKENTAIKEELDELKESLNDKKNELDLKINSINFIQEILSAEESKSADYESLNKDIYLFESFIKGQFIDLNNYAKNTIKIPISKELKQYSDEFEQWASTKRKDWLYKKKAIAFVGEFSAGKTSIVNRILSQDDENIPLLPVSTKATTAIATYISGGKATSYDFIAGDHKKKNIKEDTFKKVSKDILDQVKGISSLIKYFVMTYNNPNLQGLSILDTPGFSSNDMEDSERTIEVINECDALFWVFDVNNGTVNRSSLAVIKENLRRPIYVVINKVDTKADSEVQEVEDLIRKTFKEEGMEVQQFIRFSSKADLSNIMEPIKSIKKNDIRENFIENIKDDIDKIKNDISKCLKEKEKTYKESLAKGEEIKETFSNYMLGLENELLETAELPKHVSHFFSSDKYEMSIEEGELLLANLDYLAQNFPSKLMGIFHDLGEQTKNIEKNKSKYDDCRQANKLANRCIEEFARLSKKFNNEKI